MRHGTGLSNCLQQRRINHLGDTQHGSVQGILDHDGPKALVETQWAFLPLDGTDTVPHALVLCIDGQDLEAEVRVVDDGARALDVQPVYHRLQGEQGHIGAQAACEAGHELREVGVQHTLHRFRPGLGRLPRGATPVQKKHDQLLYGRADDVMQDSMQDRGEHQAPQGQQALAVRDSHAQNSAQSLLYAIEDPRVVPDDFTLSKE